jgi:probable HAF family extracellular repeat protein
MRGLWARAIGIGLTATALGAAPVAAEPFQAPERITVTELRGGDGRPLAIPFEVNERGEVAAMTEPDAAGDRTAVLWSRGRTVRLAPEGVAAWYGDVSDRGQAVGFWTIETSGFAGAFSWSRGQWAELTAGDEIGRAVAVNDRGQVLGHRQWTDADGRPIYETVVWGRDGTVTVVPVFAVATGGFNDRGQATVTVPGANARERRAGVWQVGGAVTLLGSLGGDPRYTYATSINEAGHVAGYAQAADGETHAFLWRGGEMIDLGTLAGRMSYVVDLNERDEVTGLSMTADGSLHGFVWRGGEMIDLGTVEGASESWPKAINDRGEVVGGAGDRAFLWRDGEMVDLSAVPGAEAEWSEAIDINNRGQILGSAGDRTVLWTAR